MANVEPYIVEVQHTPTSRSGPHVAVVSVIAEVVSTEIKKCVSKVENCEMCSCTATNPEGLQLPAASHTDVQHCLQRMSE